MNNPENTPESVRLRAEAILRQMPTILSRLRNDRLESLWQRRAGELRSVIAESSEPPRVTISLVGGTGAGKSTLINALLDARILPVSNMRACTAAVTEVSYCPGGEFEVEVEFVSRACWEAERERLIADIRDSQQPDPEQGEKPDGAAAIRKAAWDRLRAVYGLEGDTDPSAVDLAALREPPAVSQALAAERQRFRVRDLDTVRERARDFLDSKHAFWPLVKRVQIRGPFDSLRQGITLVDLPGINDPNEAREEVTRGYLKSCRFVWIVFNIKRVLTKDTMTLMQSEDFLRQIVMDGRAGALTFVGTAADDVDLESGIEEFGLGRDATELDVVLQRNESVRREVQRQLDELAVRLGQRADESPERVRRLMESFRNSVTFATSANEYLRLRGLSRSRERGLTDVRHTEIPNLREHMNRICSAYSLEARAHAHHRRIELVLEELGRELDLQAGIIRQHTELSAQQRKELEAAAKSAAQFLELRLQKEREAFLQAVLADQEVLVERLKLGVERARNQLGNAVGRWSSLHWATLRAVARRNGRFMGSTGYHDFHRDLAEPVLNTIAFAWTEFFGDRLVRSLEKGTESLVGCADGYQDELLSQLRDSQLVPPDYRTSLERLMNMAGRAIREQLADLQAQVSLRIQDTQRQLYNEIPGRIEASMRPAFEEAAGEFGPGMKARMLDVLKRHAERVSGDMFNRAREAIQGGVRELTEWLRDRFDEMAENVREHSRLADENLRQDAVRLSEAEVERRRQEVELARQAVDALISAGRTEAA